MSLTVPYVFSSSYPRDVAILEQSSPFFYNFKVGDAGCEFDPWVGKIPLEKEIATHPSILAWEIPWIEEPGRLQSMGSQSQTQLGKAHSLLCGHTII